MTRKMSRGQSIKMKKLVLQILSKLCETHQMISNLMQIKARTTINLARSIALVQANHLISIKFKITFR